MIGHCITCLNVLFSLWDIFKGHKIPVKKDLMHTGVCSPSLRDAKFNNIFYWWQTASVTPYQTYFPSFFNWKYLAFCSQTPYLGLKHKDMLLHGMLLAYTNLKMDQKYQEVIFI